MREDAPRDNDPTPDPRGDLTLREWEDRLDWLENHQRAPSGASNPGVLRRFARLVASAMKRLVGGRAAPVDATPAEAHSDQSAELAGVLDRLAAPREAEFHPSPAVEAHGLPPGAPAADPLPNPIPSWRRPSVLVVEDDRSARATLTSILERSAFDVWEAGTVEEALGRLADRPDWVLLDLMLPDGSGCAVLENVNAQRIGSKVCVISGAGPHMIGEARSLGVRHVLPKPLNLPRLMDILAT